MSVTDPPVPKVGMVVAKPGGGRALVTETDEVDGVWMARVGATWMTWPLPDDLYVVTEDAP